MKQLTLIRHAKSSHTHAGLTDIERPLNARGLAGVALMADVLKQQDFSCDAVFCSPAARAQETATGLFDGTPLGDQLRTEPDLYTFDMEALYRFIELIDSGINHAVIVGHNPAITLLTNDLAYSSIDNVPTCGIVRLKLAIEDWVDIAAGTGELIDFDRPGNYREK